jgi:hypothetical protein
MRRALNTLSGDPQKTSADTALFHELASDNFCRVDRNGKADALRHMNNRGINPDHLSS